MSEDEKLKEKIKDLEALIVDVKKIIKDFEITKNQMYNQAQMIIDLQTVAITNRKIINDLNGKVKQLEMKLSNEVMYR